MIRIVIGGCQYCSSLRGIYIQKTPYSQKKLRAGLRTGTLWTFFQYTTVAEKIPSLFLQTFFQELGTSI